MYIVFGKQRNSCDTETVQTINNLPGKRSRSSYGICNGKIVSFISEISCCNANRTFWYTQILPGMVYRMTENAICSVNGIGDPTHWILNQEKEGRVPVILKEKKLKISSRPTATSPRWEKTVSFIFGIVAGHDQDVKEGGHGKILRGKIRCKGCPERYAPLYCEVCVSYGK